jgi:hypothetical protein
MIGTAKCDEAHRSIVVASGPPLSTLSPKEFEASKFNPKISFSKFWVQPFSKNFLLDKK